MKPYKLIFLAFIGATIFLISARATAQTLAAQNASGNGELQTNAEYRLWSTVGQPLIGVAQNAEHHSSTGFGYTLAGNLSSNVEQNAGAALPTEYRLEQNYPNPFNPQTTIAFSVPENYHGQVSLRVYDMTGKLVRELINEDRGPGRYRVVWDGLSQSGSRLASGLYLYQLRAGSFATARKLILMK